MKRSGFSGYGLRSETMRKSFRSLEADITVTAVADPRHAEIAPGLAGDPYFAYTPVSYTHLDVYKRQGRYSTASSTKPETIPLA